jgi:hypothetical protein
VLVLLAVWLPALWLLSAAGAPGSTRHAVWSLVSHPLWFLLVYLMLTALTPVLRAAVLRGGSWSVLPLVAVVALADAARGHGLPAWLSMATVPVAWAVPYLLGVALAEGRLPRRAAAVLLPLGVAGGAVLVSLAGYPASAVGVPGAAWSNLDPPSLFTLATVYCWHQSALLLVTFAGLPVGGLPGLLDAPTGGWPAYRLLWLPLFAVVLAGLCSLFHRFEARTAGRRGG